MEPWPLDRTKRSRSAQCGLAGLWRRWRPHRATAMSAMPMGAPGWPELACWTASMDSARIALAICWASAADGDVELAGDAGAVEGRMEGRGETRDFKARLVGAPAHAGRGSGIVYSAQDARPASQRRPVPMPLRAP